MNNYPNDHFNFATHLIQTAKQQQAQDSMRSHKHQAKCNSKTMVQPGDTNKKSIRSLNAPGSKVPANNQDQKDQNQNQQDESYKKHVWWKQLVISQSLVQLRGRNGGL